MIEFTKEDFVRLVLLGACLDELGYNTSQDPSIDDSEGDAFEAFLQRRFPEFSTDETMVALFAPEFESLKERIIAAFRADTPGMEVTE